MKIRQIFGSQTFTLRLWYFLKSQNSHVSWPPTPGASGVEAWEAPYQFPLPLEGRYWDGDFRCDGEDQERPCRGADVDVRCLLY